MKTGFKGPMPPQKGVEKKSPFNYKQPIYDERSSCYVDAGFHHGTGSRQPVGTLGGAKQRVDVLPYGRVDTLRVTGYADRPEKIEMSE